MKNFRKGEIDGLWLFLIGIFVVLPAIQYITGYGDKSESGQTQERTKVVSSSGDVLSISSNSASVRLNTQVKIPIKNGTVIVKKTSPDKSKSEAISIKGKYAITSFDQEGAWGVDMYDENNILLEWVKVTVY